jgi:Uma2 family endonuclease
VVKIAQSRLESDRTVMARIYAASGIPAYWILNIAEEKIEVYTNPAAEHYQAHQDYRFGQDVPLVIEGTDVGPIPVTEVLP